MRVRVPPLLLPALLLPEAAPPEPAVAPPTVAPDDAATADETEEATAVAMPTATFAATTEPTAVDIALEASRASSTETYCRSFTQVKV